MGPMGPMGPMMNYQDGWSFPVVVALLVLVPAIIALITRGKGERGSRQPPRRPEDILRERYARGELGRQQYLDALIDILKDRCIRGEIELAEYERRLDLLLQQPARERPRELERKE